MNFHELSKEDLVNYLEFLLHNYRVMDAFWFLNIENRHSLDEACKINELVWGKVGSLAARDIKKRFGPFEPSLEGFIRAFQLFPWTIMVDYNMELKGDELYLEVPCCPAQEGRLRHGLGEYPCKAMHIAEITEFARELDPAIKVENLFAPPDPHPEDMHCRWRITRQEA